MASIPYKQPGTMQLAVQLKGERRLLANRFGLLINSGRRMPRTLLCPAKPSVVFELGAVNSGDASALKGHVGAG